MPFRLGATMRLTFPAEFMPSVAPAHLEGALPCGWRQGAVPVPFTVTQSEPDPRVVCRSHSQAFLLVRLAVTLQAEYGLIATSPSA